MTTQTKIRNIDDILALLGRVEKIGSNEYKASCPVPTHGKGRGDINPSLHIKQNRDKLLLDCKVGCATESIVKALGLEMSDLFLDGSQHPTGRPIATFSYQNAGGSVCFIIKRFPNLPDGKKVFEAYMPNGAKGIGNTPRTLYRLPEVIKAKERGEVVFIVEGEKDVETLRDKGLVATTPPFGANSKWLPQYTDLLRDANVAIVPDTDPSGLQKGNEIANALRGSVASLKLLELQGGKDISEWMELGGTIEYLQELIEKEPEYIPGPTVDSGNLSEPILSSVADVYELLWKPEGVRMEATIKADNPTGFKAEIVISDTNNRRLSRATLNFLDSSKKASLAKVLNAKLELDWDTLLEQATEAIIKQYRQGEPYIDLATVDASSKRDFRLYPLLVEGVTNLFYGDKSSGKSYVMYLIALCVQNGLDLLGFTPRKGKVLILDNETTKDVAKRRTNIIKKGLGLPLLEEPTYHKFSILHSEIVQIQRMVMQKGIDLVIVDSVGKACGGDTTTQEIVTRYFANLDKLGVTTLSLDHISKGEGKPTPYGSVYKQTTARMIWEFRGHSENDNVFAIALHHRKDSDGRLQKAIGIKIEFEGDDLETDKAIFSRVDLSDIPELARGLTQREQIISILKDGAKTASLISEETEIPEKSVITTLNRYKNNPFIKVLDEWGIVVKDYE